VLVFTTQLLETGGIESHLKEFCFQLNESKLSVSILVLNSKAREETHSFYHEICDNSWIINHPNLLVRYLKLLLLIPIINLKGFVTFYSNGQGNSIYLIKKLLFKIKNWVHHHHTAGDKNDRKTWTKQYLKTLQNASVVIACAQYNAEQMNNVLTRKVISIPCYSRAINLESKSIDYKKIKIGYIGRLIKEKGIETAIHYPEILPLLPAYSYLGLNKSDFGVSANYSSQILSLPMFPELSSAQITYVVDSINQFFDSVA
jgi:glycosyltransferase involved in cell wall biosynthesis